VALLAPAYAFSQETPKAELFGGYSYFRADDVFSEGSFSPRLNLHGWNASIAGNFSRWLGVEGDFSGHYGSPSFSGFDIPVVDSNVHFFMGGPKIAYRPDNDAVTPFAHFLIGAARLESADLGFGGLDFGLSETALAAAIGGGVDIRISEGLAVRAIQADYLMTRFDNFGLTPDERQNNLRLSFGLVVRF
jgi:hypothetical protein